MIQMGRDPHRYTISLGMERYVDRLVGRLAVWQADGSFIVGMWASKQAGR